MNFPKDLINKIKYNFREIETINQPHRKGSPQVKYVIEIVPDDGVTLNPEDGIPEEYLGYYMTYLDYDPHWEPVHKVVEDHGTEWVRVKEVAITTYEWQEI